MEAITIAAILGLISVAAAFILPSALGFSLGAARVNGSSFASLNVVYGLMGAAVAAGAFACLQFWFFRKGFRALT